MAFHPFRYFRKHQKVFFAVMIMVCMVTFVFSGFGGRGADPFYRALYWIGIRRPQGDLVTTLYGKKLYQGDLDKVRRHRQLASEFLLSGAMFNLPEAIKVLQKKHERKSPDNLPNPVQRALQAWQELNGPLAQFQMTPEQRYQRLLFGLRSIEMEMDQPDVQKNPEHVKALDTIAMGLAVEAWNLNRILKARNEFFFGGTRTDDALLDFEVWKHQADKLGIVLTAGDVAREVNRAWGNRDVLKPDGKFENNEQVQRFFRLSHKVKQEGASDLLAALTDEFRVLMTKEALLGEGPGVRAYRIQFDGIHVSPTVATPDEFLQYFQKQRTTLAVRLLPIPVDKFTSKVDRAPTEEQLQALYNRYKDNEPSPTRSEPGFKEPRRVKVQYFSFSPDTPEYKKRSAEAVRLLPVFSLGAAANNYPAGGGVAAWARAWATLSYDAGLLAQYEKYLNEERDRASFSHFPGFDLNNPRDSRVQPVLALLGQATTLGGTGGPLPSAAVSYLATTELCQRATLSAFGSSVLAGTSTSPFQAMTLPVPFLHSPQPLVKVKDQMRERLRQDLARVMLGEAAGIVLKKMTELYRPDQPGRFEEYIQKAIKDYALENYHSMATAQTRQQITDHPDPALDMLKKAYEDAEDDNFMRQLRRLPPRPDFVGALFAGNGLFSPERGFKVKNKEETFVFWRIEDKAAHPRPFEKIRAEVKEAWYMERARKLARDEALRLNAELKKKHQSADDAVAFLNDQKLGSVLPPKPLPPENVAHLIPKSREILPGRAFAPTDFKPYKVPADLIAYPPPNFVDRLLTLKQPGDSLVLADQPQKHFYVVVLMEKPVLPEKREFYEIYRNSRPEDAVWGEMMKDRRREYQQKLLEQLRREAGQVDEQGNWVLPDEVRRRSEGSESPVE